MGSVAVHASSGIEWQKRCAPKFLAGLKALGIDAEITSDRQRQSDIAIVLGTTMWRDVEHSGRYLLVDRASYGDPDYVSLVWSGHGRRGNHCVPENTGDRWVDIFPEPFPWDKTGRRVIVCGQTESYSPHYDMVLWYDKVIPEATHFRRHPVGPSHIRLPPACDWTDAGRVITLNSSVGVESVLKGIPTVTMDEAAMAWDVTGHRPDEVVTPDRTPWLAWLAWTQWHWDEIEMGEPIRHLFEVM